LTVVLFHLGDPWRQTATKFKFEMTHADNKGIQTQQHLNIKRKAAMDRTGMFCTKQNKKSLDV